jgi:hypothetical protein
MLILNDMIACEDDRRQVRLFKCAVQSKTLEGMSMSDTSENKMRDASIDEVEVGEDFDGRRLESQIPRVVAREVSTKNEVSQSVCVLVENGADFTHICETVIVFSAQCELAEIAKSGDANSVEVPTAEKSNE